MLQQCLQEKLSDLIATSAVMAVLLVAFDAPVQARQGGGVAGTVVDERGDPVANATILIVGSNFGVLSDADGRFRLTGLPAAAQFSLRITMIGFGPVTTRVSTGTRDLRVELKRAAISLDAVVVTGTAPGVQQARSMGNTVSRIAVPDVLSIAPIPDVSSLISGRAPGVVVNPGTGQVGGGGTIRIRGGSSFSLNSQPLIYIDGIRADNSVGTEITAQGGNGVVNRLNDINPEDIESIEIIKGPAAATLYGTEASNGVIQIITKKGRAGRTQVGFTVRHGANWFRNAEKRIDQNWGLDPVSGEPYRLNLFANERLLGNPPIFTSGHLQGYGANISGGSQDVQYYVSADLDFDEGIEANNHLWRLGTRANLTIAPDPKYDITASFGYTQGRTNFVGEQSLIGLMGATIFGNPSSRDTSLRGFFNYPPEIITAFADNWQDVARNQVSLQFNHRPAVWFQHRLIAGQDRVAERNSLIIERLGEEFYDFIKGDLRAGRKIARRRDVETSTFDYSATVSANLLGSLSSSTTVGAQYYRRLTELVTAIGNGFPTPELTGVDATAQTIGSETFIENNTLGAFVQQQFSLNDRIFLTGAIRGDDNSAFGREFNFVVYPKVSAAWVIGEEDFWNVSFVDALKLRAAYGESGQQPDAFSAVRTLSAVTGGDGQPALTPDVIGNDSLGPEVGSEFELGFDAGIFNSRVGLEFTYHHTRTRDAILSRDLPPSFGFPGSQFVNIGEIKNTGFELQLNGLAIQSRNVALDLALNLSTNSNEIIDLGGVDEGAGFIQLGDQRRVPDFPVGSWFRRKVVSATLSGTGPTAVAEDLMCDGGNLGGRTLPDGTPLELGGSPVPCDEAPRLFLGVVTPRFEGSLGVSLTLWRSVRLYGLVDWKAGHRKLDNNLFIRCHIFAICEENYFPERFDPTVIAEMQSFDLESVTYSDAGHAKIREVAISWTLPSGLLGAISAERGTLTLAGRNLHTFTGYSGIDPEASCVDCGYSVYEQNNTPPLTSFVATLSLFF